MFNGIPVIAVFELDRLKYYSKIKILIYMVPLFSPGLLMVLILIVAVLKGDKLS